jgi:hypothetical protein
MALCIEIMASAFVQVDGFSKFYVSRFVFGMVVIFTIYCKGPVPITSVRCFCWLAKLLTLLHAPHYLEREDILLMLSVTKP